MGFKATLDGRKAYRLHLAGNKLDDQKKFDEAQQKFNEALALYKWAADEGLSEPRVLMAYGVLLLKQSRFEEAREVMLKTEKLPGMGADEKRQLRLNFAVCQWKLHKLDHAIELMKRVGADGMNSMIYGSLGYMLIEKAIETGDFSEAIQFNDEAYEYDEEDPVTLDNLGQLRLAMGEREKAKEYFNRALKFRPGQVDTLYYLAKMAHEDKDDAAAREFLNAALTARYSALCTTSREQARALLAQLSPQG